MTSFWVHFTPKLFLMVTVSALGGFMFGYDTGIVSGALIFVVEEFDLSDAMHELVVSITLASAAALPLTLGVVSRYLGRKTLMALSATLFSISSCVLGLANSVTLLLIGRLIVGCAIGILSAIGPVFISECSPTEIRGALVTFYNFNIILGQFCAYVVALIFGHVPDTGWRYMFGLGALPAILQIIGLAFLPESPRYLIVHSERGSESGQSEAMEALEQLRPRGYDVRAECEQLTRSLAEDGRDKGILETFRAILKVKHVRRALLIGCSMQMFQQIVGINTVMYYCASIVQMAGVTDKQDALLYSALITAVFGLCGVAALFIVDSLGRKKVLVFSATGTTVGLVMLTLSFVLVSRYAPELTFRENSAQVSTDKCANIRNCNNCALDEDCGVCYLAGGKDSVEMGSCVVVDDASEYPDYYASYGRCDEDSLNSTLTFSTDGCPSKFAALIVLSLIVYLTAFSVGYGPIPWVFNSEIYPQWARSTAVSIATTTNWTFNLIISISFLSLVNLISQAGAFAVYGVFAIMSVLFYLLFMPETKGVSLEEVGYLFGQKYDTMDNVSNVMNTTDEEISDPVN